VAADNNYTIMVMERPANDDEIREYSLSVVLVPQQSLSVRLGAYFVGCRRPCRTLQVRVREMLTGSQEGRSV
jgi:hypothetical protein